MAEPKVSFLAGKSCCIISYQPATDNCVIKTQHIYSTSHLQSSFAPYIPHTSADKDGLFRHYRLLYVVTLHSLEFKEIQSPDCSMLSIFKITNSTKRRCTVYKAELGTIQTQAAQLGLQRSMTHTFKSSYKGNTCFILSLYLILSTSTSSCLFCSVH